MSTSQNFTTCFVQLLQWWHRRTSRLPASITPVILVLSWMTPLRCSDAGVDIVDRSCYKPRYQSGFCTRIIHNQIRWCKHWWWCRNSRSKVKDKLTRWQTTSTDGGFGDEQSDWTQTDVSGLGDDFDGERSETCGLGLTLASGVLDCESDEQQMATLEWRTDASALRPSEVRNNTGVMIVKHLNTSLQLSLVTLH